MSSTTNTVFNGNFNAHLLSLISLSHIFLLKLFQKHDPGSVFYQVETLQLDRLEHGNYLQKSSYIPFHYGNSISGVTQDYKFFIKQ